MQSKLIDDIKTKEEIEILSDEINLLLQSLFRQGEGDFDNTLRKNVRHGVSQIISAEIVGEEPKSYLEGVLDNLGKIKSVSITLAYHPPELTIKRFYEVIQSSISKKIVLELLCDPQIVGGVIVSYGGRYSDYSFRKIFEDELEATRGEVIELIKINKK